jgi:hypothetical protein
MTYQPTNLPISGAFAIAARKLHGRRAVGLLRERRAPAAALEAIALECAAAMGLGEYILCYAML